MKSGNLEYRRVSSSEHDRLGCWFGRVCIVAVVLLGTIGTGRAQSGAPTQIEYTVPSNAPAGPHVDEFTGSFSFGLPVITVPGPDGSSYSMTLSYRSGASPDAGASWVGYGWSLNAGAIVRNTQGFPDDWKDSVLYRNKQKENWTVAGQGRVGVEFASFDTDVPVLDSFIKDTKITQPSLASTMQVQFNNRKGFSREFGLDAGANGIGTIRLWDKEGLQFNINIDPVTLLQSVASFGVWMGVKSIGGEGSSGSNYESIKRTYQQINSGVSNIVGSIGGQYLTEQDNYPASVEYPFYGEANDFKGGITVNIPTWILAGVEVETKGTVTRTNSFPFYRALGSGYLWSMPSDSLVVQDYYRDRKDSYDKSDKFLPMAFGNADVFSITGGLGQGSFRFHSHGIGQFRPNAITGSISIQNIGLDIHIATRFGPGGFVGLGSSNHRVGAWINTESSNDHIFKTPFIDENYFCRFGGDMGGNIIYSTSDDAQAADISDDYDAIIPASIPVELNNGKRVARTGAISFRTNRELADSSYYGVRYRAYGGLRSIYRNNTFLEREDPSIIDQIGEFTVISAMGSRFVYGIPVYSFNEKTLNFGLHGLVVDSSQIHDRYLAFQGVTADSAGVVSGEERKAPYATTYLLTEIYTPDYVDRTHDGPTTDDYGGYTLFHYEKVAGSTRKDRMEYLPQWYGWRSPFRGLFYSRGQLSEAEDDQGAVASGFKEMYYLQSIETKTHIAYFVTGKTDIQVGTLQISGSGKTRRDGYAASNVVAPNFEPAIEVAVSRDSAMSWAGWVLQLDSSYTQIPNRSRVLERIELYAKDDSGVPDSLLSTVRFDYDYSLRPGHLNSIPVTPDTTLRGGMLTLRRVWSESQGIHSARIYPYEFNYAYRAFEDYPEQFRVRNPEIARFADSLSAIEQNPRYGITDIDRWGSYRLNGPQRARKQMSWLDQHPDTNAFDPAAWQLKSIRTPTQSEIEVQYEQNSYCYVQDQPAMGMVSLRDTFSGGLHSYDSTTETKYYLNLADLGVSDTDRVAMVRYAAFLKKKLIDTSERMYFRLLYALVGDTAKFDDPDHKSEYISGYAFVRRVEIDSTVGSPKHFGIYVRLGEYDFTGALTFPKMICHDYVEKNKLGRLDSVLPVDADQSVLSAIATIQHYWNYAFEPDDHCKAIDYANSYVRIPLLEDKKGGGIRVRRLLAFDKGSEGDSTVYGTEYIYSALDSDLREYRSSGVATNEPSIGREENSLFRVWEFLLPSDKMRTVITGHLLSQYEGPIGASLLPSPSIGYSRVVVRSIFTGKTNPGFSVSEYYTAKDAPFLQMIPSLGRSVDFTELNQEESEPFPWLSLLSLGTLRTYENHLYTSQGYRFVLGDRHGLPKRSLAYGGDYDNKDSWFLSAMQETEYYGIGEQVPTLAKLGDSIRLSTLGKDVEVSMESRYSSNNITRGQLQWDVSVGLFPFTVIPSAKVTGTISDISMASHVTSKIIRYPTIAKRTLSYADGVYHITENVAFDSATGVPVIQRTTDGFNSLVLDQSPGGHRGTYYSYAVPVTQRYPELGSIAVNEHALLSSGNGLTITKAAGSAGLASLTLSGTNGAAINDALGKLHPGDIIRLKKSDTVAAGYYHVDSTTGRTVHLLPVSASTFAPHDTTTGTVSVEVLRSGRRNQLGGAVEQVMTYGESYDSVRSGRNFQRVEPGGYSGRRAFADSLNARLAQGGGLVFPASIIENSKKFFKIVGGSEVCTTTTDTLRVAIKDGRVVFSIGAFQITDSIVGTPGAPHGMVGLLNHYLDSLWGFQVKRTDVASDTCRAGNYVWKAYSESPEDYVTLRESLLDSAFANVNGSKVALATREYLVAGDNDSLAGGFQTTTNGPFRATGLLELEGTANSNAVRSQVWVSSCDGSDSIVTVSLRGAHAMTGSSSDTTLNYPRPTNTWIDSLRPYTTFMGKFAQDSSGYLTYTNYRSGGTTGRIFGVRFHRSDTLTSRLVCSDTLLKGDGLGHFAVTDQGELVYYASDRPGIPQRVACVRFCPTEVITVERTLDGVIAAGVGTLQDRHAFDAVEYPPLSDGNAFERGERGRWWPERSYIYRTGVVGGTLQGTSERNYNNAGVFNDFTLYNWVDTTLNDTLKWIPGGVVTRLTPFGVPVESRDPLGVYSTMKLGYDNTLPILVAGNATYESVCFQSFEELAGTVSGVAHTGNRSLALDTISQSDTVASVKVTSQIGDEGLLIRLWVKTTNRSALDSADTNLTVLVNFGNSVTTTETREYHVTRPYRLAQTGEWGLYQFIDTAMGSVEGDYAYISIASAISGSTFWVDDIVMQPVDAEVGCSVYDRITRRPMAALDNQGFAAITQYNAEGAPVRTIVETAKGVRTIAEAHGHVPGVYRPVTDTSGTHTISIGGPTYSISNAGRFRADGDGTDSARGLGGRFELLDVEIGPDGNKVRVLGSEHPRLPRLEDLHLPSLDTTKLQGLPKLPGGNEYKLIDEYRRLAKQGEAVAAAIDSQSTPSARGQLERQAMSLRAARARILRRLHLTEEEVRGVIEGAEVGGEKKEEEK